MAFMGLIMTFLVIVIIILGISAFITFVCFLSSGLIMLGLRKKNKDGGKIKKPWYVVTLRVIGTISAVPLVLAFCIVVYAIISASIDKKTNLARAVMSYDYVQAERILKNGTDPDVRDKYGRTLLMCVISHYDYISADDGKCYRLENNGRSGEADEEDLQMIELLIEYGADVNAAETDCGHESYHIYSEVAGTDIYSNSDHSCGNTPLIYAVRTRSVEIVELLIDNGADVNAANACGFTPILMCADMRVDDDDGLEIATLLIDEGADIDAVTNFHQDIMWLLYRRNLDDNSQIIALIEDEEGY